MVFYQRRNMNNDRNSMGEEVHQDDNGNEYVLDEHGGRRPPMKTGVPGADSSPTFRTYDTSRGHCGLCGRLGCNGGCFK